MSNNKSYIIYDHISPSGKHYIGQTCQKPYRRWGSNGIHYLQKSNGCYSQNKFANAIKKYGWDNFEHKILFTGLSQLDANMVEEDLVHYYKKIGKSYNIDSGGKNHIAGFKTTETTREKLRKANIGKHYSDVTRIRKATVRGYRVLQYSVDNELIAEYLSAGDAAVNTGINRSHIRKVCLGNRKTAGGYVWKYKEFHS